MAGGARARRSAPGPPDPNPERLGALLAAAEQTFARAVVHGVLTATSVTTPFGHIAAYRELYPRVAAHPR